MNCRTGRIPLLRKEGNTFGEFIHSCFQEMPAVIDRRYSWVCSFYDKAASTVGGNIAPTSPSMRRETPGSESCSVAPRLMIT